MKTLQKQQGLTLFSWILVLIIAGFFLLCAFKIIPLYAENRYVVSALKSLTTDDTPLAEMTDAEIRRKLANFYMINNVRSQGPQNIEIQRDANKLIVKIDYEARVTLFDNAPLVRTLDVVVVFQNHLDSAAPNLCCTVSK